MNKEQIERIDKEIERLDNRGREISLSLNYSKELNEELQSYIHGRIDSLKWVKENI